MAEDNNYPTGKLVLGSGVLIGLWAIAALAGGLSQAGSASELIRQYIAATSMITSLHPLVDYSTHIKGIEYLICVAFFVAFPVFYLFVKKEKAEARAI